MYRLVTVMREELCEKLRSGCDDDRAASGQQVHEEGDVLDLKGTHVSLPWSSIH